MDEITRIREGLRYLDVIEVYCASKDTFGVKFFDKFVIPCGIDFALVIGKNLEEIERKILDKEYSYG